jgi:hypothetical protein
VTCRASRHRCRAQGLRVLRVLGLVVALAAYRAGGHPVRTRNALTSGLAAIHVTGERTGLSTGLPPGRWVYRYGMPLRITATVLVIAIILLAVPGLIELIGRLAAERAPSDLYIPAASLDHGSHHDNMRRCVPGPMAPSIWS